MAKRTLRKRMVDALLICLGSYMALAVLVMLLQRRMIYHPYRASTETLSAAARAEGLHTWENKAGQRIGWKRLSGTQPAVARVLVLHGNAGCALDRSDYVSLLQQAAACDAFIMEYPGYGDRPGAPSQQSLLEAASEAFELLPVNSPIYLVGESLGTGIATYLAGRHPNDVTGVLLIAPYDSLTEVARSHMPLFPVRWLLWDNFPSDQFLKSFHGPVAIWLAGRDNIVPSRFGRRLYDSYQGPKKLWEAPDAGHNDLPLRPLEWWKEVFEFWKEKP